MDKEAGLRWQAIYLPPSGCGSLTTKTTLHKDVLGKWRKRKRVGRGEGQEEEAGREKSGEREKKTERKRRWTFRNRGKRLWRRG